METPAFAPGTRVRIIDDSCYAGKDGTIVSPNLMPRRWNIAIDGDDYFDEVSFYEHEMKPLPSPVSNHQSAIRNPQSTIPMDFLDPVPVPSTAPAPPPAPASFIPEDPAAEQDREDAFGASHEWAGKPLRGFSIERHFAFIDLRTHLGAPRLTATLADGNAFYPDACRILWLCSVDTPTILRLRKDPEAMDTAVREWARQHCPPSRSIDAVRAAITIFDDGYITRSEIIPSAMPSAPGSVQGNAPGPSGGPNT